MNHVVIAIGSNINPKENIQKALNKIDEIHSRLAVSSFIKTKPVGFTDQPDFLNGAVLIETSMDISYLKSWLDQVEKELGRIRTENKYGPRTIDLDVAVWNGVIIDKDVFERDYLKKNILEVWPELISQF